MLGIRLCRHNSVITAAVGASGVSPLAATRSILTGEQLMGRGQSPKFDTSVSALTSDTYKDQTTELKRAPTYGGPDEGERRRRQEEDQFVRIPEEVKRMKTLKIPDHIPRNEQQLFEVPVTSELQRWVTVPLLFFAYMTLRFLFDPFDDSQGFVTTRMHRDDTAEKHYQVNPELRPGVRAHADAERRRQLMEEFRNEKG